VISSGRIMSLSGAYVGIAEGVDGLFYNPAAVANRYPFSLDWWDWDLDVGFLFPTAIGDLDFDNDGAVQHYDSAVSGTLGGSLQFGRLGFGFEASFLGYGVTVDDPASGPRTAQVNLNTGHLDFAYGFWKGAILIGLGIRGATFEVPGVGEITGVGLEGGLLVRPDGRPFRLGVSTRAAITSDENTLLATGVPPEEASCERTTPVEGLWVPCHLAVPWEVSAGASWRFGHANYNEPWVNPKEDLAKMRRQARDDAEMRRAQIEAQIATLPPEVRGAEAERLLAESGRQEEAEVEAARQKIDEAQEARRAAYVSRARRYLLVSASLTLTGPSPNALGVEAFLIQREIHSGRRVDFTPALGVETEVWANVLRLRAGSYLEPTRFSDSPGRDVEPRAHGTAGFDLRLFGWDVFGLFSPFEVKMGSTIDVAPHWLSFSVGLGIWH